MEKPSAIMSHLLKGMKAGKLRLGKLRIAAGKCIEGGGKNLRCLMPDVQTTKNPHIKEVRQ